MKPILALGAASALAAGCAGPAAAEARSGGPHLVLTRSSPWTVDLSRAVPLTGWEAPMRRAAVTVPIGDRVELVAVGSKEKTPKAWSAVQRTSGPSGRSGGSKGARVGLRVEW